MHVQCTTAKNLLISNVAPSGAMTTANYGTAVTSTHAVVSELTPGSTTKSQIASGTPDFFYTDGTIDAVTGTVVAKTATTAGTKIYVGAEGNQNQYVKHSFWLMAQSLDDLALSIESISFSEPLNATISQSLRMGIYYVDTTDKTGTSTDVLAKDEEGTTIGVVKSDIFNLGANGTSSYLGFNGGEITPTTEEGKSLIGELTSVTTSAAKVGETTVTEEVRPQAVTSIPSYSLGKIESQKDAASISASKWHEVDLYFWYEGQDEHCTANDALDVQAIDITVKFQAIAVGA
ncbi:MAG: hypothetical protein MJ248_03875, partial [Bacilli bacterium]|nr:hypothetical protein [Bacilli bacterium]